MDGEWKTALLTILKHWKMPAADVIASLKRPGLEGIG